MKLHGFFRSGTSHRLRIALNLKGLAYRYEAVDLRREQHLGAAYKALHPQGLVPALQTDGDEGLLIQSPAIERWCTTWIVAGFDAIQALLAADRQRSNFCFGVTPTLADVYLVPQVGSARRFKVDISRWPLITEVDAACAWLAAFSDAAPAAQPDAV